MPFIGVWISLWLLEYMILGLNRLINPRGFMYFQNWLWSAICRLDLWNTHKESWHKVEEHTCTMGRSAKEHIRLLHHLSNPRSTSWRSFLRREFFFVGEMCKICFIMKSGLWFAILFMGFFIQLTTNLPTSERLSQWNLCVHENNWLLILEWCLFPKKSCLLLMQKLKSSKYQISKHQN